MINRCLLSLFAGALLAPAAVVSSAAAEEGTAAPSLATGERCFELRTYYTHPGKLEALHSRFRNHTNSLFLKHGMTLIGYWVPEGETDVLVYLLAYPSKEARENSWKAFMEDPEWKRVHEESHKDGPIVMKVESKMLKATDYSALQ